MSEHTVCSLEELEKAHTIGFLAQGVSGFVVIRRGKVYAYVNACPHLGTELEFMPNRFLNLDKTHILCSTHGALFRIEDGLCIHGPCTNGSLQAIPTDVRNNSVIVRLNTK